MATMIWLLQLAPGLPCLHHTTQTSMALRAVQMEFGTVVQMNFLFRKFASISPGSITHKFGRHAPELW